MIYGYCRISRAKQSIDRQIRNIQKIYPTAKIIKIVCSGSKVIGYRDFEKAIKEANRLKDAMDKEKAMLEEKIKTMEKRRNTPDDKTVAQAVGRAIFKEVENQEKIKTPQEIGLELQIYGNTIF